MENNLIARTGFRAVLCSFILPSVTLLPISGTSDLEKDLLVIKGTMQDATLCPAWQRFFLIMKCYRSLVSGKWPVCKLKERYKTPSTQDLVCKILAYKKHPGPAESSFAAFLNKTHFLDMLCPTFSVALVPSAILRWSGCCKSITELSETGDTNSRKSEHYNNNNHSS